MLTMKKIINKKYISLYILSTALFFMLTPLFGGVVPATCHWDCHWYSYIANHGYGKYSHLYQTMIGMGDWCFFPLYILMIKGFSYLSTLSVQASGLIINNIILFFIPYFLIKYNEIRKCNLDNTVIIFLSFFSIFCLWDRIQYTECVYGILLLISLYNFYKKNMPALMASIFLLSFCRPTGFVVGLILSFFLMKEAGFKNIIAKKYDFMSYALVALVGFSAIGLYSLYLYHLMGDGLAFSHAQIAWERKFRIPVVVAWNYLKHLHGIHLFVSFLIDIVIIWYAYKRKYCVEATILLFTFLISSSTSLMSIHRYIWGCPLTIIVVADFLKQQKFRHSLVYGACVVSFVLSSIIWFMGLKYLF
ncbi:hypothetical protein [Acetobacter fabarum]|uniref:hypothetical protein n=2 Tax=Acetobacter fabarum TaxID=483199 RepID=UPI000BF1E086|nr:hypothetical protein [Acetobacter fabarum]PEN25264.1 hypothetical protein CRM93_09685 [Acetobacter fabarum]